MLSTVSSFMFFLGVLAFLADLGVGAATAATAPDSSPDWLQESAVAAEPNSASTIGSGPEQCNMCVQVTNKPARTDPSTGIPKYRVEIVKICGSRVSKVDLNCSQFSSAKLIPETIFKHIGTTNQCLVYTAHNIANGHMIPFRHHNAFQYGLSLSSCDMRSQVQAMNDDDGHLKKDLIPALIVGAGAGVGVWYFFFKK